MKDIIVIGGNHHNALGVIRSLGQEGVFPEVILITDDKNPYIIHSKYIKQSTILTKLEDLVPYLLKIREFYKSNPTIISCADNVTSELDMHQHDLADYFCLPLGRAQGSLTNFMKKDVMANRAEELGLIIPKTSIIYNNSLFSAFDISYPCIVKPLSSIEGKKSDIAVLNDKEGLDVYLSNSNCKNLIVQQYIEKDIEYQLIGCSINHGEDIIIPGVSIVIRPDKNTNTGFLRYVPISSFECDIYSCKEYVKSIGYSGLFSMEYLRDKNGQDYFMEMNMRNDGNSISVTAGGVNLPYIWYLSNAGKEYEKEVEKKVKEVLVMPEFNDFRIMLRGQVSFIQWVKDIKRTNCFMEYSKDDPRPFEIRFYQLFIYYIRRLFRK